MNGISSPRKERVLIDESVMEIYRSLRADGDTQVEQAPFSTYKDIFMLAACLGFSAGRRTSLPGKSATDIRESVFTESDLALLKAIAIAHTQDVAVLSQEGEVLRIAEEYAQTGIARVKTYLLDERGSPLRNLVNHLLDTR